MLAMHDATEASDRAFDVTPLRAAALGALAGACATLVMSTLMLPARWLGVLGIQPPRRIVDRVLEPGGTAASLPEPVRRVGTAVVHLGSGATFGALFGLCRRATRLRGPSAGVGVGVAYGVGVWGVNYVVAAPALDLFEPPWEDRPARPWVMLGAHVIYGFVTAVLFDRAVERSRRDQTVGQVAPSG